MELEDIDHNDPQNDANLKITDKSDAEDDACSDEYESDNDNEVSNNNHVSFNAKTGSFTDHHYKYEFKLMDETNQ